MKHWLIPVLLCTCVFPSNSYSQWEWQNPLPQGNNLNWITFVDANTAFAVGDKGTIMKTSDKGQTWSQIYFGYYQSLTGIFFVNSEVGYAVGSNLSDHWGYAFKTTDGGSTWMQLPVKFGDEALCIWFIDENTGYVGTYWALYKTIDGGENWNLQTSPPVFTTYWSIYFTDSLTGYLGGMNKIYKTEDGGQTWNVSYYNTNAVHLSLFFPTHDTGFAVDRNGIILKTTDGGQNWIASSEPEGLFSVFFSSPQTGIITGTQHIYRTTDGGATWQSQPVPVSDFLLAGAFADSMNAITVGNMGTMITSSNGGYTWQVRSSYITADKLKSLYFTSEDIGYAAGSSGTILKTEDGGHTWQHCSSGTDKYIKNLFFTSPELGYACGNSNTILKTSDGGTNWFSIYTSADLHDFTSVQLFANNIGYCLFGGILKTTDAGNTWNDISLSGSSNNSMFFTSSDTGYFCGNNGQIQMTTDAGNSYISLNSGVTIDLKTIYFTTKTTGFATGQNLIIKTSDAGQTWETKYTGSFTPWMSVSMNFSDSLHGFLIDWDTTLLITNDGGETWQQASIGGYFMYPISAIYFIDSLTGYIAGSDGAILKTTSGGVVTGIKNKTEAGSIIIFPNPNNGRFYINLNEETTGEIMVYGLNGKLNYQSELKRSSHEQMVDLNPCTPGIYILKVRLKDRIMTGKIVVLH